MAAAVITLRISFAWWFKLYVIALICFAQLHGLQPDPFKLHAMTMRALRINGRPLKALKIDAR